MVISSMSEQPNDAPGPAGPKRPPTPGSWKPGQSGNVKGRPRKGDALAERIREQVSPEELIAVAREIIAGTAPPSVKLQAAQFLAERGYAKPAERHEVTAVTAEQEADDALAESMTNEQLDQLDELDRQRDLILAAARARALPPGNEE